METVCITKRDNKATKKKRKWLTKNSYFFSNSNAPLLITI